MSPWVTALNWRLLPAAVQAGLTDAQKAVAGVVDPSAIKQVTTTAEAAVSSAKPWVDQVGGRALTLLDSACHTASHHLGF